MVRVADGEIAGGGLDFLMLDADGRIRADYQFIDAQMTDFTTPAPAWARHAGREIDHLAPPPATQEAAQPLARPDHHRVEGDRAVGRTLGDQIDVRHVPRVADEPQARINFAYEKYVRSRDRVSGRRAGPRPLAVCSISIGQNGPTA